MAVIARGVKAGTGTTAFGSGTTALSAEVNTDFNTVYSLVNGNIDNANIKAAAGIESSKLSLSSIAQNVSITGDVAISGSLTVAGTIGGSLMPIGTIIMFAGTSTPVGDWLTCAGQAVNRTTYAELYAAIGDTYGAGDGVLTFNLPNLKGRVAVGRDTSASEFDTLGETGGEKTHQLTTAEIPAHTHLMNRNNTGASAGVDVYPMGNDVDVTVSTRENTGGDGAHNNLQPYITLNYYIKY